MCIRDRHYVTRYAQNVDMWHPEASASFTQTVQGMQYQGKSKQEAINMAATVSYTHLTYIGRPGI